MSKCAPESVKVRIYLVAAFLTALTFCAWTSAFVAYGNRPALLSAAGIAYSLGLRHALDADHISAIDNVTRKLINSGKISTCVGLFFSLGHSSLIFIGCAILYVTEKHWENSNPTSLRVLNIVSSSIASTFLLAIGIVNTLQLFKVFKELRRLKREKIYKPEAEEGFGAKGCFSWCFKGLFDKVSSSVWMLLVGLIFGLGFDTTASITAIMSAAAKRERGDLDQDGEEHIHLSVSQTIIFPLLFTAGMVLIDTADSIMMLGTYKWSDKKIVRKLFFNCVIQLISAVAALAIGVIIGLELIVDLTGCADNDVPFCNGVEIVGDQFQYIGIAITALFILIWGGGYLYYVNSRWARLENEIIYLDSLDNEICDLENSPTAAQSEVPRLPSNQRILLASPESCAREPMPK